MKILYKILVPIVALLAVPAFFTPILQFVMTTSSGSTASVAQNIGIKEKSTIIELYNVIQPYKELLSKLFGNDEEESSSGEETQSTFSKIEKLAPSAKYLKGVSFCLCSIVLCILLICGFSIFSKKYWLVTLFCALALLATFGMNAFFNSFAAPFLSGETSISSILGSSMGTLASFASLLVGTIKVFRLSTVYNIFILIFAFLTIFTGGYAVARGSEDY